MTITSIIFRLLTALLITMPGHAETLLHDTTGHSTAFSTLKGKWVFIHYWASWCQTCLEELPELNHFYELNKDNNVALFAVNYDTPPLPEQKRLIQQLDIRFPSLATNPARMLRLGGIRGVPVTFVFNPEGELVDALYGPQTVESLQLIMKPSLLTKRG